MKTFFYGYGLRETKSWDCPDCKNFHTCGMDLSVDESIKRHKQECKAKPKPKKLIDVFQEANDRALLKDLVWWIYANPEKVRKAIDALTEIAEEGGGWNNNELPRF